MTAKKPRERVMKLFPELFELLEKSGMSHDYVWGKRHIVIKINERPVGIMPCSRPLNPKERNSRNLIGNVRRAMRQGGAG